MKVSVLKEEGLTREIEVTVPAQDIQKTIDRELVAYGQRVRIDGFRKGKVPLQVLKTKYGSMVMGEVLQKTVESSITQVIKDKDLRPALQPKVELKEGQDFKEGSDLTYTMTVEVLPTFKVMDLSKIAVEKPVATVEDKAVNETLERIAKSNRSFTKVEEARALKKGDVAVVDFHGALKDGTSLPGMSGHDMSVELGSGQLIPGFEEQLEGQKVGAHAHVDVTFPKDYGVKELAGKDAMFHVDIKEIREPGETKLDDDLAKKLRFESLDKLKETITKEISEDYAQFTKMKVKRALLDTLDENHEFDLPQGMIVLEYQSIVEQMEKEKEAQNEKLSDEDRENLKAIAERRVRLGLVLAEIGKDNKIDVTRDELYKAIHAEARKYPGQETQVLEFYSKNPQIIESFRAPLYEEKVIEFILGKAKVDEKVVPLDVLTKEDDDELPKAKKKKAAAKK
jgi:trigger factor